MSSRLSVLLPFVITPLLLAAAENAQLPTSSTQPFAIEQKIESAQKRIAADPKCAQCYSELATALCRKGRDTGDAAAYNEAQSALDHALQLAPGDFAARKLEVTVLLGKQQLADALKLATELNGKVHDDISGWALLVDANIAAGNKEEAVRDAQWILDLRPGSSLGFEKAAELRAVFHDPEGAADFFAEADRRISLNDPDEHCWLLSHQAQQELARGQVDKAAKLIDQATKWSPESKFAASVREQVKQAQEKSIQAAR